ncbi:NAD(P)/FAD-dependent oxidoreductase [Chachezhania sediminis]|uniref:NAD(P)/FAD-dependent oxidoreductase n=1 Tax=Chachezhania sediminis TaxID=2599291 RepID=UPI00131C0D31|nr:FAD-dependent oxidoreductase [Chachezhania sediminis]
MTSRSHHAPPPFRIAVIGAGVVGLSTALWLQKSGHAVTLFDPAMPDDLARAAEACSFGNACTIALGAVLPVASPGIHWQVPSMLADRKGPLSIYWRDLPQLTPWLLSFLKASGPAEYDRITAILGGLMRQAQDGHLPLFEEAGATDLIRKNGCLYLYRDEASFRAAKPAIDLRAREGVAQSFLDAGQIREREPGLAPLYHRGLLFDDAYHLDDPATYLQRLLAAVRVRGAECVARKVTALLPTEAGIVLRAGEDDLSFDRAVVAAGAWSRDLALQVGDTIRLNSERGYHVLFENDGPLLSAPTCYPEYGFYMTPLTEGLRSAGTVELGGLGKPPRPARTDAIEERTRRILPAVGQVTRKWLGFRPSTPDSLPVIGPSAQDPRVLYGFGHGHVGLTLAGLTGKLIAQCVDGQEPSVDLGPLRPDRWG